MNIKVKFFGLVVALVAFATTHAFAQTQSAALSIRGDSEARILRIDAASAPNQTLALGRGKSVVVSLDVDARDVLVANPDVVEAVARSTRQIYLFGLQAGQTNAFFFDDKGEQILDLEIRVDRDLTLLRDTLARYLPSADIDVEAMQDHVIISGRVDSAVDAHAAQDLAARFIGTEDQVLNLMEIRTDEQVLLKVTIAEMERSVMKDLGLDWNYLYQNDNLSLGLSQILPSSASRGSGLFSGFSGPDGAIQPSGFSDIAVDADGLRIPGSGAGTSISAFLQALERNGLIKTLAEPNLTAISGETAEFLAGGEFPVPVGRDQDGNITVAFKEFGVGLQFTPLVLDAGRISLQISTEVSELTLDGAFAFQDVTIPGVKIRKAETTVELPSGGSLVIAGLLSETTEQETAGVPGLKELPVPLFRNSGFGSSENELVIIVTPYLVEPSQRNDLVLPTDGFVPPDMVDILIRGRLNHAYGKGRDVEGQLQGPVGFVLE